MHGCLPVGACENVTKLPEQLLPSSKPKDPAPLPCEDQAAAAKTPWPLAVEDAQVCCYIHIYIYAHVYIYMCILLLISIGAVAEPCAFEHHSVYTLIGPLIN